MIITLIKKDWSSKSHSMLTPEAKYTAIRTPLQRDGWWVICFVCLFGFLTSSSTTRLYRGRAQGQSVWQFYVLPHTRQSWETMTSASAGHIILTPTQTVGSGRPQRGPPHQESRALPTELPRPTMGHLLYILLYLRSFTLTHPAY